MKKNFSILIVTIILVNVSCASFLRDEDAAMIKEYENALYILKKDVGEGEKKLEKGQKIKLYIKTSKEFIKIYCYSPDKEFLKTERILILYLFENDFNRSTFDREFFEEKLYNEIQVINKSGN